MPVWTMRSFLHIEPTLGSTVDRIVLLTPFEEMLGVYACWSVAPVKRTRDRPAPEFKPECHSMGTRFLAFEPCDPVPILIEGSHPQVTSRVWLRAYSFEKPIH
jgi:hypothetical protein